MSANDLPINFSYAKWTPNTRFKLCNVPWDMGYRDIVKWDSKLKKSISTVWMASSLRIARWPSMGFRLDYQFRSRKRHNTTI